MRAVFAALPWVARSSSPLLIGGEPGTGKALIAREVHALSDRADGPFTRVDCAALPQQRVRQALATGLESARGGTVLLDNIGKLSVDLQARLLRVMRNEEIGAPATAGSRLDVRIISTTDTGLEKAVETGRFRAALFNQLNVLCIEVPPLRERGGDVQLLADFFLQRYTSPGSRRRVVGFTTDARLAMQQWGWPGNVRELVECIKKAIVLCEKGPLFSSDLDLGSQAPGRLPMTRDDPGLPADLDRT